MFTRSLPVHHCYLVVITTSLLRLGLIPHLLAKHHSAKADSHVRILVFEGTSLWSFRRTVRRGLRRVRRTLVRIVRAGAEVRVVRRAPVAAEFRYAAPKRPCSC